MEYVNLIREFFYVSIAVFATVALIFIHLWDKNKKESNRISEYTTNINSEVSESIPELIEGLIIDCFQDYIVLNVEYQQINYIDDTLESKITKEVGALVAQRISPALLSKISTYYSLKEIGSIISDKVYLTVLNYVLEKNSIKEDKDELN